MPCAVVQHVTLDGNIRRPPIVTCRKLCAARFSSDWVGYACVSLTWIVPALFPMLGLPHRCQRDRYCLETTVCKQKHLATWNSDRWPPTYSRLRPSNEHALISIIYRFTDLNGRDPARFPQADVHYVTVEEGQLEATAAWRYNQIARSCYSVEAKWFAADSSRRCRYRLWRCGRHHFDWWRCR